MHRCWLEKLASLLGAQAQGAAGCLRGHFWDDTETFHEGQKPFLLKLLKTLDGLKRAKLPRCKWMISHVFEGIRALVPFPSLGP